MTTTSQNPEGFDDQGLESNVNQSESQQDAQGVPVGEFIEMRKELRAARDELASLKAQASQPQNTQQPANTQASDGGLADAVRQLQQSDRMRNLTHELGLTSQDQAEAVAQVMNDNPALNAVEAYTIASNRDGEKFGKVDGAGGFDPGTHGSMRPRSVSLEPEKPAKSDFQQRTELLEQRFKHDKVGAQKAWNNWVGHFAAKEIGREHDLIPLPKPPQ